MKMPRVWVWAAGFTLSAATVLTAGGRAATAATVNVVATKDNTLYENGSGSLSNAKGDALFAGRTGANNENLRRRAVMAFDLGGSVPAGSTITGVSLTLQVIQVNLTVTETYTLRRLLADWGEGTSTLDQPGGGAGAAATTGDATWVHRFFNATNWSTPGGDFTSTVTATQAVSGIGSYVFNSPQLTADVQGWVNNPSANFGWILTGDETIVRGAKAFASREHDTASLRPTLAVTYEVPEPGLVGPAALGLLALACRRRPRR